MKDSWRHYFRRLVTAGIVTVATGWSSAMCYAVQLAFDSPADPAYNNGWQDGDNGGFGFTPWDFSSTLTYEGTYYGQYTMADFHAIDDGLQAGTHYSNPFNNIGKAWDVGSSPTSNGPPRAGRGFAPLQVGQTLKLVIDNPTRQQHFKGYFVRLTGNTGGVHGNICYGGYACTPGASPMPKMNFSRFEFFNYGEWRLEDAASTATSVFDTDTAAAGALFSVTRTGTDNYDVQMTSLGGGPSFSSSRTFSSPGVSVDWIELTFFNTPTDADTPPTTATDFYLHSMEIIGAAPPGVPGDYNGNGVVDAADYVLWRNGGPLANEVDMPGTVNAADYTAWRAAFGNTSGAGSALIGSAVPEPGTLVCLVTAVGSWVAFGSKRMSRFPDEQ